MEGLQVDTLPLYESMTLWLIFCRLIRLYLQLRTNSNHIISHHITGYLYPYHTLPFPPLFAIPPHIILYYTIPSPLFNRALPHPTVLHRITVTGWISRFRALRQLDEHFRPRKPVDTDSAQTIRSCCFHIRYTHAYVLRLTCTCMHMYTCVCVCMYI